MYKYLIFGAGAVGTLLGGLLAKQGHQVVFVGRKWNVDGIQKNGIQISGIWGEHEVSPQKAYETISDIPNDLKKFDYIMITAKAFDTEQSINECLPVIDDGTYVISCQNGYGNNQIIADKIGWEKTLGARFITGVEIPEPGVIHVTVHADAVRLGHYRNELEMDHIREMVKPMQEAGIPIEATDQLEQYIWAKILYNASLNPLGALLGVTYGDLAENEPTRTIMNQIMEEAFAVTSAWGIQQFWNSPGEYRDAFYQKMIPPTASHFPSMLRDLERGRRTEIDSLNGAIVRLGKQKDLSVPVNETLVSLIRFRESQVHHD